MEKKELSCRSCLRQSASLQMSEDKNKSFWFYWTGQNKKCLFVPLFDSFSIGEPKNHQQGITKRNANQPPPLPLEKGILFDLNRCPRTNQLLSAWRERCFFESPLSPAQICAQKVGMGGGGWRRRRRRRRGGERRKRSNYAQASIPIPSPPPSSPSPPPPPFCHPLGFPSSEEERIHRTNDSKK